jgi:hypothetical protein
LNLVPVHNGGIRHMHKHRQRQEGSSGHNGKPHKGELVVQFVKLGCDPKLDPANLCPGAKVDPHGVVEFPFDASSAQKLTRGQMKGLWERLSQYLGLPVDKCKQQYRMRKARSLGLASRLPACSSAR